MQMHSVAIDNFKHAKFWLGNHGEFTLKDPFIAMVSGRLFFAFISAFLKFCSDFASPHMPCSPLFDIQRLFLASLRSYDQAFWKAKFLDDLALFGAHLPFVAFVIVT